MRDAPPLLLPRPRSVTRVAGIASGDVSERIDSAAALQFDSPGGYRLSLLPERSLIEARDDRGRSYARATLKQLHAQYGDAAPAMVIEDGPGFATRGVMLDVSRDRVPTMAQLFETVDLLASLKINHLQLYTEHTFAYAGHEAAWRNWSPITPTEVRELDVYCTQRGIELAANQNCFGHLAKWLTIPKYSHLAETLGDWVFQNETESFPRSGPFSLCPTDARSGAFVEELLGQLLPCFSSSLVNIGCDETFDVGWGRSRAEVETRGRSAVYFDFVRRIDEIVRSHGKRPMFWADIALTHPESIPLIPDGMIGLAWGYEPDAKFGEWCSRLREANREVWVCPGTSSWRSITGRTAERRANIRRAAQEGAAHGASGFLITDWGDSGHHQQWPIALCALAEAADAAWNPDGLEQYDPRAASLHALGDTTLRLGPWLDELGNVDHAMRTRGGRVNAGQVPTQLRNSSVLFCDLHMPTRPAKNDDEKLRRGLDSIPAALWEEVVGRVHALSGSRPKVGSDFDAELAHALDVACFAGLRGLWRRTGKFSSKERRELASWLGTIVTKHRELWLTRSREGGLEDSCGFYQRIIADLEETT